MRGSKRFLSVLLCIVMVATNFGMGSLSRAEDILGETEAETPIEEALEEAREETAAEPAEEAAEAEVPEEEAEAADAEPEAEPTEDAEAPTEEPVEEPAEEAPSYTEGTLTAESDEYYISLSYGEAAKIPADATLSVFEIEKDAAAYESYMAEAAAKVFENDDNDATTLPYARFFDITILNAEGEAIEPAAPVQVIIDLKDQVLATEDVEFAAVHFVEEETEASGETEIVETELVTIETGATVDAADEESTVSFDADSFSTYGVVYFYTVDFYYGDAEYHMNGGSEMMMSDLFTRLGINRSAVDIANVEFTDETLVKFTKEDADWRITSLAPFTTSELLTMTFTDGEVIVIDVEDASADDRTPGTESGIWWGLTADGTLTIRPQNSRTTTNPAYFNTVHTGSTVSQGQATWDDFWKHKNSVAGGASIRTEVKKVIIKKNDNGAGIALDPEKSHLSYMFCGFTNLESVEIQEGALVGTTKNLSYMFYNCAKLTEVKGLEYLDTTDTQEMQRMFSGCSSLEEVDISSWENDGLVYNMQNMFRDCTSLTTVKMPGSDFIVKDNALLAGMFQKCTSLTDVEFNGMDVTGAKTMTDMFKDCTALEDLDVSTFGTLTHIVNMDGFVEGCTSLTTLNIDNLDNSRIGPTSNKGHTSSHADSSIIGASDFGRMLGIHTCTALETLSAQNSKVWMVYNNRGVPSKEYYNAADETETYYFTDKVMEFASDVGPTVTIDSDRDYIDLITDRDGTNVPTTNPVQDPLPDASTNINIANGDLNTKGAGFLAPGVYTIGSAERTEPAGAPMCDTYYRIAYIGEVPYRVEGIDSSDPDLVMVDGTDNTYINTKNRQWTETGNYVIDRSSNPIKVIYEKAAVDMNGRKYDVIITITKITFKDVDKVPTEPSSRVTHDGNNYVPTDRTYYRPILQAHKSDGLQFHNYVWTGDPMEPWNKTNCLSKGSGTDIEFTIEIDGAPDDTSFVFKGEDLDVAADQTWNNSTTDACYDNLPIQNATYGVGGEGFILGDGNVLSTLRFAEHTGLAVVDGNKVIATGSDPDTTWSEFAVKADAQGSNYTWTSGIGCTSYALRNTKSQNAGAIKLQPEVLKELLNGTLAADQFEFVLEEVSKESSTSTAAPSPTNNNQTKKNDASGKVTFDAMEFKPSVEDGYYPGTDTTTNEHNVFTYTYKVYEKVPTDATDVTGESGSTYKAKDSIIYDATEHTITVVITPPKNETEMIRGIKAEIYVDKTPGTGVTPDKTYWHHDKACVDCTNGSLVDIAADKWYDENGNEVSAPNPISLSDIKIKNKKLETTLEIPVQKILQGRKWKDSDEFAAGLVLVSADAPMPTNTTTIGAGEKVSEVVISSDDTAVKNDADRIIGYKDKFDAITYKPADAGKTYTYHVRELTPAESGVDAVPGVTYDTEKYDVEVTVVLDDTDPDNPKLVATATYTDNNGDAVTISSFTNIYEADETDYKMEAVKDFYDVNKEEEITLTGGEFTFVLKPTGDNAAIAPMPVGTEGTGVDRKYYKTNENDGDIEFENDPTDPSDGIVFNYKKLLEAGIDEDDLHSDKGVDFEYEIYELIPGTEEGIAKGKTLTDDEILVNNEDGTHSVIGDAQEIVYDGVHHTRKITVKVIQGEATETGETVNIGGTDYDVYKDFNGVKFYEKDGKAYKVEDNSLFTPDLETLDVEGHEDDHKACYYISEKDGSAKEVTMSDVEGYNPSRHHFKVNEHGEEVKGAPIFINYRFEQKYVDLKVVKEWDDADDQDKIRPESLTITITSDEGDFDPIDLELKGSTWTASEKLPVYEFDIKTEKLKEITYSVEEGKVPAGYTVSYDKDNSAIKLDPEKDEYVLTITNKHTPGEGAADGDETYGLRGEPQTGMPNYKVNPNNPVKPTKLVKPSKAGSTISDDGKTVTIPGEGKYVLNDDGSITFTPEADFVGDPTPIDIECVDKQGNPATVTYTPHVIDPIDATTVTRVIKFTYETKDGKEVTSSLTQVGLLTRKALKVDPKTGEVTEWGPWLPYTFPAVKNPDAEAGPEWSTMDIAGELTITGPVELEDEYIVYHKKETPTPTGDSNNMAEWMMLLASSMLLAAALKLRTSVRRK